MYLTILYSILSVLSCNNNTCGTLPRMIKVQNKKVFFNVYNSFLNSLITHTRTNRIKISYSSVQRSCEAHHKGFVQIVSYFEVDFVFTLTRTNTKETQKYPTIFPKAVKGTRFAKSIHYYNSSIPVSLRKTVHNTIHKSARGEIVARSAAIIRFRRR